MKTKVFYLSQTEATIKTKLQLLPRRQYVIIIPKVVVEAMDLKKGDWVLVKLQK